MNLYLISQTVNRGWDTYDSAVVCAESPDDAITIHPNDDGETNWWEGEDADSFLQSWCKPVDVDVKHIGSPIISLPRGVVVASFNAG